VFPPTTADFAALIDALLEADVDHIVVGGVGAILHGALAMTQDLDVVHRRTPENVARLMRVLEQLDAYVRDPAGRRLRPRAEHVAGAGQIQLVTMHGPLDLLGQLHDGRGFDELLAHSEWVSDGRRRIRVLDLPTLIDIKAATGRPKDRVVVPLLLALLRGREPG
jgi:hypothetical protein